MQFHTRSTPKGLFLAVLSVALLSQGSGLAQGSRQEPAEVLSEANRLELQGQFKQAAQVLSNALGEKSLSSAQRTQFEFDLDRLERIKKDFPYTKEGLFEELKKNVRSLTAEEYEQWIREKRFDSREFDGQQRFMVASVANLFFRYPELVSRRQPPKDDSDIQRHYWEVSAEIKKAALAQKKPYVLPKRFHATMTVTANAGAAPAGEIVRAWLPIPRQYPFQNEFELVSASPSAISIDRPESPIRSVYLEQRAGTNQPSEFKVEYEYTRYGIWFDLKPESVRACDANDSGLSAFVKEGPHVVFTPEMRALSRQIVGDETNPCRQAKRIYDWIAGHIQYSYAIEYSTIRNIGDYCRSKGYGDCGQEALLFITLCRLNGIPARWQSGWNIFPHFKDIHDWSEIYLAPYGWVPVDPYMGVFAMRLSTALSSEQRRELRDFYFGGLEQYRMAANSDHSQALSPPKHSFRSDNVDFQRGELECGVHNIYFDQYSYDLKIAEVSVASSELDSRGGQFIPIHDFSEFEKTQGSNPGETVLTSPVYDTRIAWDQLVASWDAETPENAYMKVEARGIYPGSMTKYYSMGLWSGKAPLHPRESLEGQGDADGDVSTDTLMLKRPAKGLQVRVTLGGEGAATPKLRFVGLSLIDSKAGQSALAADRGAWNKLIPVPERSQMVYPNGNGWCSPTTVSMLMSYWAHRLDRSELDHDVPEVAAAIYDTKWEGTGNWSFNVAYAGGYRGIRAYVTRMTDLSELEDWVATGIPVGLSVCYDRLRGKGPGPEGHLVVCVGFTESGDPIINDPGTTKNVRKIFPRKNLVYAWSYSHNTAYLIYPEDCEIPKDRFGHWDSWAAHQLVACESAAGK